MINFEKFKEKLPSKEKRYSFLTDRKITDKKYEHVLNIWKKLEMKTMSCDVLLLAGVFEKFRNNSLKTMDYVHVII